MSETQDPHSLDLDAYFARIGYIGPREASLPTLSQIVLGHAQAIPFENLDVISGRGVSLDLASVQQKLVQSRRGGYCFEQNGLLLQVLLAMGFDAQPISARVRIGRTREMTPPRTHLFVRVEIEGESWLADVGVGGLSATTALRLELNVPQRTPHETRRIIHENGVYYHQALLGDDWTDVSEFTLEVMPPIDREVANWYTSMHPQSHFRDRLMVARAASEGRRMTMLNTEFSVRDAEGKAMKREVQTKSELLAVLEESFGLRLDPEVRFNVPALAGLA
ncbi:arylamine N-acetyltransferase family protein [Verrucomicrobium spinosum]|uniref:arylamine N-acetyltransferase family protein n=1 Tax=Verrucomicrobium spinosum TaxID=2736 RepID=UPI0001745346|nr:arylamine N-acetyltransferase [Verrucomicrobium spinosum]